MTDPFAAELLNDTVVFQVPVESCDIGTSNPLQVELLGNASTPTVWVYVELPAFVIVIVQVPVFCTEYIITPTWYVLVFWLVEVISILTVPVLGCEGEVLWGCLLYTVGAVVVVVEPEVLLVGDVEPVGVDELGVFDGV